MGQVGSSAPWGGLDKTDEGVGSSSYLRSVELPEMALAAMALKTISLEGGGPK